MNTKEYIESGILEAYVLGALSEQESAEVAANIALYPELAQEVTAIEAAMQHFAEATAVEPPAYMQEQVWDALNRHSEPEAKSPASPKVMEFTPEVKRRQISWQRAAVWIALTGSLLTNIYLWTQHNTSVEQQLVLQQKLDTMSANQERLLARAEMYEHEKQVISAPGMKTVVMQSAQQGKPMTGMVYWSKEKGDTYVSMVNMPMPPKGMQYQLWVIKDDKPVDMGMIPNNMVEEGGMMKMNKTTQDGQAFAISLEKEGGNPTPTTVMVVGGIAS